MSPAADAYWLRRAFEQARLARAHGNQPFGAVLVSGEGELLLAGQNDQVSTRDPTGHAELNLLRNTVHLAPAVLAGSTLYASMEPCAMCAAAIYWAGVRRVVYGLGQQRFAEIAGPSCANAGLALPCREVLDRGRCATTVLGPMLEAEAARDHQGYWRG